MKRGNILYADISPTVGSEVNKRRPVLIVSNDANNRAARMATVLPITSNTTRIYPFEVALSPTGSGLSKVSKSRPSKSAPSPKSASRDLPSASSRQRRCRRSLP